MELNEEPQGAAPGGETVSEEQPADETEPEAAALEPESEVEEESPAPSVPEQAYGQDYEYEDDFGEGPSKQSLLRRLSPYLTVAGIFLILRIVVYSFRRRR